MSYASKVRLKKEIFKISVDDPNDFTENSDDDRRRDDILHEKLCLEELFQNLRRFPKKYYKCEIERTERSTGVATVIEGDKKGFDINLPTTLCSGRTFNGDSVVVKLLGKFSNDSTSDDYTSKCLGHGKVIGVLRREISDIFNERFVCRVDDRNCSLMIPVDHEYLKFHVQSPLHAFKNDKVYLFKSNLNRESSEIELSCKKIVDLSTKPLESQRSCPQLFLVRYISWSKYFHHPEAYVEEVLTENDNLKALYHRFDIKKLSCTDKMNDEIRSNDFKYPLLQFSREDLTDLFVFTIDDKETKIRDDGLSIQKCKNPNHKNCWKMGVHITDVGSLISEKSDLYQKAKQQLISFETSTSAQNFVSKDDEHHGKIFPPKMYNLCSFNEHSGKKYLAISTFFHSDEPPLSIYTGKKQEFFCSEYPPMLSVIQPKYSLSYEEAQKRLNQCQDQDFDIPNFSNIPQQLNQLLKMMWQFRLNRLGSAAVYINDLGKGKTTIDNFLSRMIVEEAMITSNAYTALYLHEMKTDFIVRTLLKPPEKKMMTVGMSEMSLYQEHFHKAFKNSTENFTGVIDRPTKNRELDVSEKLWKNIQKKLKAGHIKEAVFLACCDHKQPFFASGLASFNAVQNKADFLSTEAPEDLSHFLLQLSLYTRCSSPLRRFVDLDTQIRLVKILSGNSIVRDFSSDEESVSDLALSISRKTLKKEKQLEIFGKFYSLHNKLTSNGSAHDVVREFTEGYLLNIDDFKIQVFFPNFWFLQFLDIPLFELGSTNKLGKEKMEWILRFYDIPIQRRVDQPEKRDNLDGSMESHFKFPKLMRSDKWMEFVNGLKTNLFSLHENCLEGYKTSLKNVNESITEIKDSNPAGDQAMKTSNGIYHGRKIEISVKSKRPVQTKTVLDFQFSLGLENGIKTIIPQLLILNSNLDHCASGQEICLLHRRHTTIFDVYGRDIKLQKNEFENSFDRSRNFKLYLYYEKWLPLVLMDGIYASVHNNSSIILQLDTMNLKNSTGRFTLRKRFCDHCFVTIRKGDYLCIRKRNLKGGSFDVSVAHGIVTSAPGFGKDESSSDSDDSSRNENSDCNSYEFKVFEEVSKSLLHVKSSQTVSCEVISLSVPHRRILQALNQLPKANEMIQEICVGDLRNKTVSSKFSFNFGEHYYERITKSSKKLENFPYALNESQKAQILRAFQSRFTLIQGPPGTGKSYMGAHLAYYFAQLNLELGNMNKKVLYCGPSNKSVDVVANYLRHVPSLNFMRVYSGMYEEADYPIPIKPDSMKSDVTPPPSSLRDVSLHHAIRLNGKKYASDIRAFDKKFKEKPTTVTTMDYKAYKKLIWSAKLEELESVQVILCTCSCAGGELLSNFEYGQCIVDECGMCSEPETLVPIIATSKNTDDPHITLIGDHKQLQSVTLCHAAAKLGLRKSLFERLEHLAERLNVQYRMDPVICEFSSEHFYKGTLTTDKSVLERIKSVLYYRWTKKSNVAMFCDVDGLEEDDELKSKFNKSQVQVVIKVLNYLLNEHNVKPSQIMVLSPYLAQCRKLRASIENNVNLKQYSNIHIGTVVTSQGSEADYIILSTVRSSSQSKSIHAVDQPWLNRHIGFVTDDHQINVAITRAKLGLFIVGNATLLRRCETWRYLLEEYESREAILDEDQLDELLGIAEDDADSPYPISCDSSDDSYYMCGD